MRRYSATMLCVCLLILALPAWSATLRVCPSGCPYTVPSQAAQAAQDGDVIEIEAATYQNDAALWKASNLTIKGINGRAIIQTNGANISTWGGWVLQGNNTTIEHVEISGPHTDGAGACIRLQGLGLTLRDMYLHDADHGLLTGNPAGAPGSDVLIEASEFTRNGTGEGQDHNIYVGSVRSFTLRDSYSHDSNGGQLLKSRAAETTIENSRLIDSPDGTSNYEADFSNGGVVVIKNTTIQQAVNTSNAVMVTFMPEGPGLWSHHSLTVEGNTLKSQRDPGYFLFVKGAPTLAITNNTLVGRGPALTVNGVVQPLPPTNTQVDLPPAPPPPVVPPPAPSKVLTAPPVPPAPGWYELANTKLSQVDPCPKRDCSYSAVEGQSAVVSDWNSAVMDTKRNRLVIWGGGHQGYWGNELYALYLDTFTVERLTEPGMPPLDPGGSGCNVPDTAAGGTQPVSRHTWDGIVYLTQTDQLWSFSGGKTPCGYSGQDTWTFDFATKQWERKKPTGIIPNVQGYSGITAAYDPTTNAVFLSDIMCYYRYDVAADRYEQIRCGGSGVISPVTTSIIDPVRKRWVLVDGKVNPPITRIMDITPGAGYPVQTFAVANWQELAFNGVYTGLAYDPISKQVMAWNGGDTVFSLDMDTQTWSPMTFPGGPGPKNPNGTYKRWSYSPQNDVFVVVNDTRHNAFVLRPARDGAVPPIVPPVVPPVPPPVTEVPGAFIQQKYSDGTWRRCTASGPAAKAALAAVLAQKPPVPLTIVKTGAPSAARTQMAGLTKSLAWDGQTTLTCHASGKAASAVLMLPTH